MRNYRRKVQAVLSAMVLFFWAVPCSALESAFKETLQDALYGGVAGTLVGAAVMAFTKRMGNHLDYMGYGATGGILVGAAVGLATTSRSLAVVEKGKLHFTIPTVIPEFKDANYKGQSGYVINADMLGGKF
ncbi:MAG TPA: hypothetical protein VHN12_00660 [Geobacteraceae bacterium]|nr:hypothetical protein [Geobacteraceae bacterium]